MKLATLRLNDSERLALVDGNELVVPDCADLPKTMGALLKNPQRELDKIRDMLATAGSNAARRIPLNEAEFLPPVPAPSKIVAIGLNYHGHAQEVGADQPSAPIIFAKFPSSLIGAGEEISWRESQTARVDYEAELAVVIGRTARNVPKEDAPSYILGYTCANDISARDLQFGDEQWTRGKSLDTFCPMGPWIVTPDELADPMRLQISCTVNGQTVQQSSTGDMFFDVNAILSYCSQHFTLSPGDVILTGTPGGVGEFRTPQRLLASGDVVTVSIEGIGILTNRCKILAE